jgi:RecA/RadA recombinase
MPRKKKPATPGAIRTQGDLIKNISSLASEFTGAHKGAEAVTGGSTLLDSLVNSWIPTGCPNFDSMLQGGFPCGRVSQMFGAESTGKSTLLQSAFIQCSKMGGVSILLDPELGFDPDRFRRMGGDPDTVILIQKEYGPGDKKGKKAKELGLPAMTVQDVESYIHDILSSIATKQEWRGKPVIVGLDSLDNLTTDEALLGEGGGMAKKPRLIREMFRRITAPIAQLKACFVIISQTIETIGGYGAATTTAGGGGPRFISSVRIQTKKFWDAGDVDQYSRGPDKQPTGNVLCSSTVVKNKLNRPYTSCVTAVNNDSSEYFEGIDPDYCLLYGMFHDVVKTRPGAPYKYLVVNPDSDELEAIAKESGLEPGKEYPFLQRQWRAYLKQYPGVRKYLEALARNKFKRPGVFEVSAEVADDQSDEP